MEEKIMNIDIKELKHALATNKVKLTFTKLDGTDRDMLGTTDTKRFEFVRVNSDKKKVPNPAIIKVWDLEKNQWRSVRVESIKSWSISAGE
jgi:hypothetical protein